MQRPSGGKQPGEHGVGVTGAEKRPLGEKGRLFGLQGPDCIFKLRKSLLKSSAFMLRATETTSKVLRKSALLPPPPRGAHPGSRALDSESSDPLADEVGFSLFLGKRMTVWIKFSKAAVTTAACTISPGC